MEIRAFHSLLNKGILGRSRIFVPSTQPESRVQVPRTSATPSTTPPEPLLVVTDLPFHYRRWTFPDPTIVQFGSLHFTKKMGNHGWHQAQNLRREKWRIFCVPDVFGFTPMTSSGNGKGKGKIESGKRGHATPVFYFRDTLTDCWGYGYRGRNLSTGL